MAETVHKRPFEPLVAQNRFRRQKPARMEIPPFESVRDLLPVPVLPGFDAWNRMYWRSWSLAWEKLCEPETDSKLIAPFIEPQRVPHLFMWDSTFEALYGLYGRRAFNFIGFLNNFYAVQQDDGFISREIDISTGKPLYEPFDPDGTGPNILAWTEWRYFRATGDEARLRRIFFPLMALYRWSRANRAWQNGLYWATGVSSGMDNQESVPGGLHHHQHWSWVGASCQAAVNAMVLQRMALVLDESDLVDELSADRALLARAINEGCWNEDTQFYHDVDRWGGHSPVKSIAAFWALYDRDLVPDKRKPQLIQHLRERGSFYTPHRVPTLSTDSPGYDPGGGFWRGAVWAPTNYMVMRGLRTVGQHALAHEIAVNHLQTASQVFDRTGFFWENYAPEAIAPGEPAQANAILWSGLTAIAILLEDVLGIWADWPLRTVYWDLRLEAEGTYGVKNYPLGREESLDLLGNREKVTVHSTTPFTLILRTPEMAMQTAIPAGKTEINL